MPPWRRRLAPRLALALALLAPLAPAVQAGSAVVPIGIVTGVEGRAQCACAGQHAPLAVLDTLRDGDRLELAAQARVELVLTPPPGRVVELAGPGRFALRAGALAALDPGARLAERDLVGDWRQLQLHPGNVGRAAVSLRGAPAAPLRPRAPVGTQLGADITALEWDAPATAARGHWHYEVLLSDGAGRELLHGRSDQTRFALAPPLEAARGPVYLWSVDAVDEDGRRLRGAAEFRVLAEDDARGIEALLADARRRRAAPRPALAAEDVLLAVLLDQAGVRDAADRQWRVLGKAQPAFTAWSARVP